MSDQVCRVSGLAFNVPQGWIDRTVVVWSAPPSSSPVPPNFAVAYDRPKPDEALPEYAERQIADLARAAQGFELELRREIVFAGRPAVEVIFRWGAAPGVMQQRQVYCALPDGRVVSVASTARAADFAQADREFRRILRSLRWEG